MWLCLIKKTLRWSFSSTLACTLFFCPSAYSQKKISSIDDLNTTLEQAILCDVDALNTFYAADPHYGPDDTRQKLEQMGVKVTNESQHGGIKFQFPPNIKAFRNEASEALFFDEGTMIFLVNLRLTSDHLSAISKILGLAPISRSNPDGYGYFDEIDVRYIRKLSNNKEANSNAVFSGTGRHQDYIVIGCQDPKS
jgi:hypothetical protein